MTLRLIPGGKRDMYIVCPWCGSKFPQRSDLDTHWAANAACRRNKFVNSPLDK